MRAYATLSLAPLTIAQPARAETKQLRVIVDVYAPRVSIRKILLKYTPVGSSITDASRARVVKTILYLGHYYKHLGAVFLTAPMVVHEDVSAQWLFDRHGRLIDIMADKQARVY